MDRSKQRDIASKGGKAAHQKGTAHEWTSEEAREAGRKGGMASHRRRQQQSGSDSTRSASSMESMTNWSTDDMIGGVRETRTEDDSRGENESRVDRDEGRSEVGAPSENRDRNDRNEYH